MIQVKTWYKTYDKELLTIVEATKTWRHSLEGCKFRVLVYINHNNLRDLWISRVQVPGKSVESRNSLSITFESIITNARPTQLLMLCRIFPRKHRVGKKNFKPKIYKFFIGYSSHWQMPACQVSACQAISEGAKQSIFCDFTKRLLVDNT